jgi:hypothetical protein
VARSEVFVSYARADAEFVRRLVRVLEDDGRQPWGDWQDIHPASEWWVEILRAVDAADSFAFVITSRSVASPVCLQELGRAVDGGKRLLPLLVEVVDPAGVPEPLRPIQWISFVGAGGFGEGWSKLRVALDVDLDHVRAHTRYLVRAREWDEGVATPAGYCAAPTCRRLCVGWWRPPAGSRRRRPCIRSTWRRVVGWRPTKWSGSGS